MVGLEKNHLSNHLKTVCLLMFLFTLLHTEMAKLHKDLAILSAMVEKGKKVKKKQKK